MKIKDGVLPLLKAGDIVVCDSFKTTSSILFVEAMEEFVGKEGVIKTVDPEKKWVTVHGWYWPMSAVKKVR